MYFVCSWATYLLRNILPKHRLRVRTAILQGKLILQLILCILLVITLTFCLKMHWLVNRQLCLTGQLHLYHGIYTPLYAHLCARPQNVAFEFPHVGQWLKLNSLSEYQWLELNPATSALESNILVTLHASDLLGDVHENQKQNQWQGQECTPLGPAVQRRNRS